MCKLIDYLLSRFEQNIEKSLFQKKNNSNCAFLTDATLRNVKMICMNE
jgi:hypothetical protein